MNEDKVTKNDSKIPPWFDNYLKPYKPSAPKKSFTVTERVEKIHSGEGTLTITEPCTLEIEKDFSNCYYESDSPSINVFIVREIEKPNPRYERDLKRYEKDLKQYNQRKKEWPKWKKIWDEKELAKTRQRELAQLIRLKKKYESK
jgi:hypothetical protein